MSYHEKLSELARYSRFLSPPIGIYIVTKDGEFVDCNDRVREILQIPSNSVLPKSIQDFYYDPEEREQLLEQMAEQLHADAQQWVETIIRLRVQGRDKFVKDSSRAILDSETNEVLGFLCCMTDVTGEELYNRLFKSLPIGLYQLDEDDRIIEVNPSAINMLGYSSKEELAGRLFKDFYADPNEEIHFRELHSEPANVVNHRVEFQRKGGEPLFVSLSSFRISYSDGAYAGQEGTIMDVTTEELYRRVLDYVPVGLYVINERGGKDIITDCNQQFAKLLEFESVEEAVGYDAQKLYASAQVYQDHMKALIEMTDKPVLGYDLQIVTRKGNERVFEDNSRVLFNSAGQTIGRVGAVRDISEQASLRGKIQELTEDIGVVLHTYSSALVQMHNSIRAVMSSFEPDPFKQNVNVLSDRASLELLEPAQRLSESLNRLLDAIQETHPLAEETELHLRELVEVIQNYRQRLPYLEIHTPVVRAAALKVLAILREIKKGSVSREALRQVRNNAQEVLRICNLISLHQLLDLIVTIEHPVMALREFVTARGRIQEVKTVCRVSSLISQSINNLNDFAINRGVSFRHQIDPPDMRVEVFERDVVRAFSNLLHNAIKYSWERKKGEPSWVSIKADIADQQVRIEFQNRGVPIPKDELERGLIFKLGFRGRLSSDRGRVGTGIGLADAARVVRDNGGEIFVNSFPAIPGKDQEDYTQPFLTTVTVLLPLHSE